MNIMMLWLLMLIGPTQREGEREYCETHVLPCTIHACVCVRVSESCGIFLLFGICMCLSAPKQAVFRRFHCFGGIFSWLCKWSEINMRAVALSVNISSNQKNVTSHHRIKKKCKQVREQSNRKLDEEKKKKTSFTMRKQV